MTCNLNGGRIYKGSIGEITVPMFPRCYTGETEDLVANFYTTPGGISIEFSVSAGTIELDGVNGTVVFQEPQLGVLDDGLLRYNTACGDEYNRDWETRWFVETPNDFTPVEYITNANVESVVESLMGDYLTITAASQTYTTTAQVQSIVTAATTGFTTPVQVGAMITAATSGFTTSAQVQSMVTAATTGFTTTAQVQSMVTAATSDFVTSADVQTTLEDYAKLTDIPSLDGYATEQYVGNAVTAATQNMVTSTSITNIWVGSEAQYNAITNKSNTTLYIIK